MQNNSFVSIVITTYNSSSTIIETLESVINQTYLNFELLIFDDCSNDNTIEKIQEFLLNKNIKLTLFSSKTNSGGPATGRNWGINNAIGEYICFLDADDIWMNTKIENQLKLIHEIKVDVVASNAKVLNGKAFKSFSGSLSIYKQILRNKIILSTTFVRREFVMKNNILFNESKDYISVEDYDFFLNTLLNNGKIYIMKEQLIYYRVVANSISHFDFKKNELKRLHVINHLKTNAMFIKSIIFFTSNIYRIKLSIWNSKY